MPDIKIKSTGRTYYQVDALLCQLLSDLHPENVERVAPPAPVQQQGAPSLPPKIPTFSYGQGQHHGPAIFLRLPSGEVIESHAPPKDLLKSFGTFRGEELYVPKHLVEEYRRAFEAAILPVGPGR